MQLMLMSKGKETNLSQVACSSFITSLINFFDSNSFTKVDYWAEQNSKVLIGNPTVPKALRAGVWEGLVNGSHTANAPLLICSPVTILSKPCDKQTY